jgi:signal peptidase II
VVVLDQVVKAWVKGALPVGGSIPLWAGVFHITHTQNRGMAFSLLEGKVGLLAVAALIVVAVIIGVERRQAGRLPVLLGLSLSLPLGGAVGNLIDRVVQGYVTDLFDFRLIHFPVFNVADSAITVGVVLLAWYTLTTPEEKPGTAVEGENLLERDVLEGDGARVASVAGSAERREEKG